MAKKKGPRQKAQAAKNEAKRSASTGNTEMDVDGTELAVGDTNYKGASFKSTKAQLEGQLTKVDKRALRQRMLMKKLVIGGNAGKSDNKEKESIEDAEGLETSSSSGALLKRQEKPKRILKTKDKPIKKARQRHKQYMHNVLKITSQTTKKAAKDVTKEDIAKGIQNLVAKLRQ